MRRSHDIDELFKNSDHTVPVSLSDGLWDRMEKKLDDAREPAPKTRTVSMLVKYIGIAASFLIIVGFGSVLYLNADGYQVEDLEIESDPVFSKEQIAQMSQTLWRPSMITVNLDKLPPA